MQNNPLRWVDPWGKFLYLIGSDKDKKEILNRLSKIAFLNNPYCNKSDMLKYNKLGSIWQILSSSGYRPFSGLRFSQNFKKLLSEDVADIYIKIEDGKVSPGGISKAYNSATGKWEIEISLALDPKDTFINQYRAYDKKSSEFFQKLPVFNHELQHAYDMVYKGMADTVELSEEDKQYFERRAIIRGNEIRMFLKNILRDASKYP